MVNSPTSSSDDSFSSLNSGSTLESFSVSPQIVIRRPIDVPVTPAPAPLVSDAIPYPRDSAVSPFRITTPVVITPVDARSTRDIVRMNRLRRVRRRQESRYVLNSIRRRLSMIHFEENLNEIQMNTPRTLPISKKIDNTSTAIELESTDAFQNIITEFFKEMESNQKLEVEIIPSPSSNCAKVREMNRLEAVQLGILGLSSDNEDEILEATGLVEWNLRRIDSEIETIDRFILDFEDEKQRKIKKWENIEQILKQMRDIS